MTSFEREEGWFHDHKELIEVDASNTKVTAAGIDALKKARPQCKIIWNGGTVEPAKK